MFSMISSIVSKVMPNIGMIGKAITGAMKAASSVMGGLSSITSSFSKLFGKMGNFMKMLTNPMSMLSKPGQCRRPQPNDFQGSKAAEGAEGKKSEGTGRKPGESIEDFLIRIMNKILENTEKQLEETANKADKETSSGGKDGKGGQMSQTTQTKLNKLSNQMKELRDMVTNMLKLFHDTRSQAIRNISG